MVPKASEDFPEPEIAFAIAHLLHQLRRRIAKMERHSLGAAALDECLGLIPGRIGGIRLGGQSEVSHRLGQRYLAFGRAQPVVGQRGIECQLQRLRVSIADVFAGHHHHAAGHLAHVAAAVEDAGQPIQGRIGVGAP